MDQLNLAVKMKQVKEEPQSDSKLPGNKNVESSKRKLKAPPVPSRLLRGGSKK